MVKKELTNRKLFDEFYSNKLSDGKEVDLQGRVRTNRNNGSIGFIEFNDGTFFKNIQLVYENNEYSKIRYGSTIEVKGNIKLTPNNKQPFEITVKEINLLNDCAEDYPLQKKRHSFEFLREIAHLRSRANTFYAVFRVRNVLTYAIHKYFQERNFVYVHTPLITSNDAEGAGQVFKVVADMKKPDDFFKANASLTVSGQLHVEAFALTYRDVYTFGPAFRAEQSNTTRHASEFWMIEPEMAFCDLEDNMNVIESFLKYIIKYVLDNAKEEMNFFDTMIEKGVIKKLEHVIHSEFKRMTYTEAIEILKKAKENGHHFEFNDIHWGMDLQSEHERYLTEEVIKGPLFLIDYPKEIKAFYMKQNADGKTVAACDLLVPYVGELIGGSQREEKYDVLLYKMQEIGNDKGLEWYLDLRKYGGCIHSGFGLGFDRLLMYITGISNIRDVQPYPRTPGSLKF
ncbi:MAG: asparagine--tRNA ligase [Firmicutes bacterium]|uniref:Asparagine--tRNA ligase n=1 Tax=Candidatus Onthovivens merdipullorum TaxID=2840889 RepID=A0A9D9GWY9_9BACL|nr:asparagine--tRNA ligase [Candidatus Onthovivens merdipullorum]